jgi:ABC-type transport system substrate-binding protein
MMSEETPSFLKKLIIIAIVLNVSSIIIIATFPYPYEDRSYLAIGPVFNQADTRGLATLDPLDSWDGTSNSVLNQIFEPLFTYAYDKPELNYPHMPNLATSYYWDVTADILTINLREDVTFHDGTIFNATTVEWNFKRFDYYCNLTGEIPGDVVLAYPEYLFHFADGVTPLWEGHMWLNETAFYINMTKPFTAIVHLLTYTATAMVSPTSFDWNWKAPLLNVGANKEDVVGTGPFMFESYSINKECRMFRNPDWWGPEPYIKVLIYTYFDDTTAMSMATIAGDYDCQEGCPTSLIPTAQTSNVVEYVDFYELTGQTAWCYCYIEMNSVWIPPAIRRALNDIYNWSYVNYELLDNACVRPTSPVPYGMPSHDPTVEPLEFNITQGRLEMQAYDPDTFGGLDLFDDAAWISLADTWTEGNDWHTGSTPYYYKIWVYRYSFFYATIADLMHEWGDLIGVRIVSNIPEWDYDPFDTLDPNLFDLWLTCWCPDYNNALSMLAPLMRPESIFNLGQNNDTQINAWLDDASTTTDPVLYNQRVSQIQHRFVEVLASHIPFSYDKLTYLIKKGWKGCNYNAMRTIYYWQMYWGPD